MPSDQLTVLTWRDFDNAVFLLGQKISKSYPEALFVYGEPRGGLPLAVALSHLTGLTLVTTYDIDQAHVTVWVDDIIDSGATLAKANADLIKVAWLGRHNNFGAVVAGVIRSDNWVLFPWEVIDKAHFDEVSYKRNLRDHTG